MISVLIAKLADAIKPSLEGGDMKGDISIQALVILWVPMSRVKTFQKD